MATVACFDPNNSNLYFPVGFYYANGHVSGFGVARPWFDTFRFFYAEPFCNSGQAVVIEGCLNAVDYPGCNCGSAEPNNAGQGATGHPINISSGNMYETATDFRTIGQNQLTARRFYNSYLGYAADGPPAWSSVYTFSYSRFGFGWRSEYDRLIVPNSTTPSQATAVDAVRADGEPVHFALSGTTWYVAYWNGGQWSTGSRTDINIRIRTDGTYWYITDASDTIEQYSATGQLLQITYRNGYQQMLAYSSCGEDYNNTPIVCNTSVTDSEGRQLTFNYLPNTGLTNYMTDAANNKTQFTYITPVGAQPPSNFPGFALYVLQQVTFPDNTTVQYSYNDPVNHFGLTGLIDENGNSYLGWTYDSTTQRAISSQLAGGADLTTILYNDTITPPTRTVTNALGKQFVYSLNAYQGHSQISSIEGLASAHTPDSITSYQYDSNGFLNLTTSGEGRQTFFQNDPLGRTVQEIDGYNDSSVARTISTTWDPTYDLPDTIVEPNLTISLCYTTGNCYPGGLLAKITETDTTSQTTPYITAGETRTWNFTYYTSSGQCSPVAGLLETVQGPLGVSETTTYCYNTNGFVSLITNPLNQTTQITSWNVWGEPLTSVDPNNVTTQYTYDSRSRLKSVTVNPGSTQSLTQLSYDNAGNLKNIVFPDSSSLTYGYDNAHRLTSIANNLGEQIGYKLDAMGDRKSTTVGNGSGGFFTTVTKEQSATFDELARLLTQLGAYNQLTQYGYDKDNNLVSNVEPRNKLFQHAFDAIERAMRETDPDSYQTSIGYNGKDEFASVTDGRSLQTSYVRDGFGDIIQTTSPDTGTTVFWYDANGKVIKKVDANATQTNYTNDVLGRVLTKKIHGTTTQNVAYTWDVLSSNTFGIGRLEKVSDPSGSTVLWYDQFGNVVQDKRTITGNVYTTKYKYDAAGHVSTATYPSGRIVTYTRDTFGRITGITTQQGRSYSPVTVVQNGTYEPFGPLATLSYGNGVVLTRGWDLDYHLSSIYAAGASVIQNLVYSDDPDGNVGQITDNLTGESARTQTFGYDDLDRLASASSGVYGSQSYQYDGVGNRSMVTIGGIQYTYTPSSISNQIVSITQTGGGRYFYYQSAGQVYSDQRNATSDYQFGYDGYGHLTSASLNGSLLATYTYNGLDQRAIKAATSTSDFLYDQAGHMIAEASSTGAWIREYIWMDDQPVAMVDWTSASPVVYDIHTDHLGRPQKLTDQSGTLVWDGVFDPFGNAVSVNGSVTMLLGFPGQFWDSEIQLAQNWRRDYDPTIGRYVESDPIGLWGGVNTYTYVADKPLRYVDLEGTGPLGGYIGGFLGAALGGAGGTAVEPGGGTAVGGIEGWEEGYAIGSGLEDLVGAMSAIANGPNKSCNIEDECDHQYYNVDIPTCRAISKRRGAAAGERCYASAAERYGNCIAGRPMPPLDTWNN